MNNMYTVALYSKDLKKNDEVFFVVCTKLKQNDNLITFSLFLTIFTPNLMKSFLCVCTKLKKYI